jgi:hypothetical protein
MQTYQIGDSIKRCFDDPWQPSFLDRPTLMRFNVDEFIAELFVQPIYIFVLIAGEIEPKIETHLFKSTLKDTDRIHFQYEGRSLRRGATKLKSPNDASTSSRSSKRTQSSFTPALLTWLPLHNPLLPYLTPYRIARCLKYHLLRGGAAKGQNDETASFACGVDLKFAGSFSSER